MKCLGCGHIEIVENGCKGFIGETVINCKVCNEINSEMEDCKDFEPLSDK